MRQLKGGRLILVLILPLICYPFAVCLWATDTMKENHAENTLLFENPEQRDARMAWWREARFGMFIHWGLYSILAGEWKGEPIKGPSSWTLHETKAPLREYTPLIKRFNPTAFDPEQWVRQAKAAGMKYIIITTKHHEGFCLFDSQFTDYDIRSTPYQRDIMKALAEAARREGIRIGWYHSILDWHHPDYLPRRPGDDRPTEGANYERYVIYLKNQVRELLTHYGPVSVMWFDGEWDHTWTHRHGRDLYAYVRSLQPDILINNRVDKGRQGMQGTTQEGDFAGDFGTPEQEIPATGLPGTDWETCMTMNDTWGYKSNDPNWKSATALIQMLVDCASKGGNFLLNVGPTASGEFPPESIERLEAIGRWMRTNHESIYGTHASPFKTLSWGRCTRKKLGFTTSRLYLHVFQWPHDGQLTLPDLTNTITRAYLLADLNHPPLKTLRRDGTLVIALPEKAPDKSDSVVVLDITGEPEISE